MDAKNESLYALACTYAQQATAETTSFDNAQTFAGEAFQLLLPLAHETPKASFSIGLLSCELASRVLKNTDLAEEERESLWQNLMQQTVSFWAQAAAMKDHENDHSPARAKDGLASLCENGIIEGGLEKAFALRLSAAQDGWAEAQINLALMFYKGEGTAPSLKEAQKWLEAAWAQKETLDSSLQTDLKQLKDLISQESSLSPDGGFMPRRRQGPLPS